jgi:hypothetical protein
MMFLVLVISCNGDSDETALGCVILHYETVSLLPLKINVVEKNIKSETSRL